MDAGSLAPESFKLQWTAAGMAMVVVLATLDYITGQELSLAPVYVIPIALVTWTSGVTRGLIISGASVLAWLIAQAVDGPAYATASFFIWNGLIRAASYLGVTLLLARLRTELQCEWESARTDFLTGAANARHFYYLAELELGRSRRSGRPLSLAYIDVDNFKAVNDRFGHMVGDQILRIVSQGLRRHLRRADVLARIGGDEFILLLPDTDEMAADALATRLQASVLEGTEGRPWPVTLSVGVITYTGAPTTLQELISAADRLMYSLKGQRTSSCSGQPKSSPPGGAACEIVQSRLNKQDVL